MIYKVLSIAGSDPSGGAGIQADLKTFSALGVYGMAALTSLTAQNTKGVRAVQELSASFIKEQLDAVFDDVAVHAVKIGMIASVEAAYALADVLTERGVRNVVLDPVMIATSGDRLISEEAIEVIKNRLLPLADLVTPNLQEVGAFLSPKALKVDSPEAGFGKNFEEDATDWAKQILALGPKAVLIKGGHLVRQKHSNDILVEREGGRSVLESPRLLTVNTHGTGCTLSAAIAAGLAKGMDMLSACKAAKAYLNGALKHGDMLGVGHGHGPVHHFWDMWEA
ncbi:MAG: bifunctional hydroxymethylpyrimidine kinase/phosphomethylpyrimidine kinase [Alphaproteobacteria bacterium]|nr:bifunctional hydroxymethylpyrimidine kinase/phosphomethylpyrimidine kinase [Alphaproteobacteria bacterium]